MPFKNVFRAFELFFGVAFFEPRYRKHCTTYDYKPQDTFFELITYVREKIKSAGDSTASAMVAAVPSNAAGDNDTPTYAAVAVSGKNITTCTYCQRERHVATKCFVRMKDQRKMQKNKTGHSGGSSRASHQKGTGAVPKPAKTGNASAYNTTSSSSRDTSGVKRYCLLHDSNTHSTEECYTFAKIKKGHSQVTGGSPSG